MKGHITAIHTVSIHASGRYALSSSSDTAQLWDLDTFQRKRKLNIKENVGIVKVRYDNNYAPFSDIDGFNLCTPSSNIAQCVRAFDLFKSQRMGVVCSHPIRDNRLFWENMNVIIHAVI